ncbi:MAG: 1,4-dihydroxy-2-naphthoate polyprenyltransferase [Actinobacteria bacterium]|nr:1,4-dihydroxy-2-naphthoate polyprenyltransferase [Actinomycetota bacterium]
MTTAEQWIQGARPRTLYAAIAPVIVGTAFAGYNSSLLHFLLALSVALSLQIGVNYANDYSDGIRGADGDRVGPIRLVGAGLATPSAVRNAAFLFLALATLSGAILSYRTSWILIPIGLISIVAAWGYTAGPKPYGYRGLGEVSVFIFFGLVATNGTYFVHVQSLSSQVLLASFALGALSCAILVLNNLRDLPRDFQVGKRTLAVVIGDASSRDLYRWLIFFALVISAVLSLFSPYYLLALLSAPLAVNSVRAVKAGASGVELIDLLVKTGRIQIIYAAALSLAALLVAR